MRCKGARNCALGTRRPMAIPDVPNLHWSLDFVSDALTGGRRFRILTVVDDLTKENVLLVLDTSISGLRLTRELEQPLPIKASLERLFLTTAQNLQRILRWTHMPLYSVNSNQGLC